LGEEMDEEITGHVGAGIIGNILAYTGVFVLPEEVIIDPIDNGWTGSR
jgi:hypothetical protein